MFRFAKVSRAVALICIYAIGITTFAPATAQAKGHKQLEWDNVLKLRKGASLNVLLFSKKRYLGKVEAVEPGSLTLNTAAGTLNLPKDEIKNIIRTARPKLANPGLYLAFGGILLGSTGELVNSVKQISTLNSGKLPGSDNKTFLIAGVAVAAAGLAILIFGGKPKVIYEAKEAPASTNQ